jgi:hypothetical protein
MRIFLIKLVIFLFPLILIFSFFEFKLRTFNSLYKQKIQGLESNGKNIEILILGSSHLQRGCNPYYFSLPAYNMAFGFQPLYYDQKIIENEIKFLPNLKYVIIEVSYHSLYMLSAGERDYFYKYYYNINPYKRQSFWKQNISHFMFVYDLSTAVDILTSKPEKLTNGYWNNDTTIYEDFNEAAGKDKMIRWARLANFDSAYAEINVQILEKLISMLKQRNIIPILVSPPLSKFCNRYIDEAILDHNLSLINRIVSKYQVAYFNLQDSKYLIDEDFYDVDHLNLGGSRKFTKALDSLLLARRNASK